MLRADVEPIAREIGRRLAPHCEKVILAGSMRRGKPDVDDLDMVCLARYEQIEVPNLLGVEIETRLVMQAALDAMIAERLLALPARPCNGDRFKKFVVPALSTADETFTLDLFIADADNWGSILAIRTGPASFSHALVTPRSKQGLMPDQMAHIGGYVYRLPSAYQATTARLAGTPGNAGVMVPVPSEGAYFEALGIAHLEPAERSEEAIDRLRSRLNLAALRVG